MMDDEGWDRLLLIAGAGLFALIVALVVWLYVGAF